MQLLARCSISLIVGVFLLSLQAPAFAADYFVKHDSMGENFQGQIATAEIIADEMYAATFQLPASWQLPVELQGVRVLMVDGEDSSKTYCGRFAIEVWEESTASPSSASCPPNVNYKDPGASIYSMSTQTSGVGFEVEGNSNNWQDLRFSAINNNPQLNVTINPVMIDTRTVRVAVKALDNHCTMGGDAFPLMVTDDDGVNADNFLYGQASFCGLGGSAPPPEFYYWADFAQYFSKPPGDFVMRLIFDRPVPGGGDAGMDAGADTGMDAGMDAGTDGGDASGDGGTGGDATGSDIGLDSGAGGDVGSGDAVEDTGGADASTDTTQPPDVNGALAITSVSPSSFVNNRSTELAIIGRGFKPGAKVRLGTKLIGVTETESGLIMTTVAEGFGLGVYDVIVTNPDGETAILEDGVEVLAPQSGQGDAGDVASSPQNNSRGSGSGAAAEGCGCRSVGGAAHVATSWAWGLALLALVVAGLRRRVVRLREHR